MKGPPIYCTGLCDACRSFADALGVPLLRSEPVPSYNEEQRRELWSFVLAIADDEWLGASPELVKAARDLTDKYAGLPI